MLKLLFVESSPFAGGAQSSFRELITSLNDVESHLLVSKELQSFYEGISSTVLPSTHHWQANFGGMIQFNADAKLCAPVVLQAIEQFQPDIIHANTVRSALLLLSAHPQCPVVLHDRDIQIPAMLSDYVTGKLSPHILAISKSVARKWKKATIIPNGFNLNAIQATQPAFIPENPTLILPADFVEWKRHELFLKAFKIAHESAPELRAILKGRVRDKASEEYSSCISLYINRLQLSEWVTFNNENSSALPYMAASDAIVACSEEEPFGRTLVEAFALGKPVIATRKAAAPELLACPAVTLVDDDTPEALAKAFLTCKDKAQCAALAPQATQFAASYDTTLIHQRLLEFYQQILH